MRRRGIDEARSTRAKRVTAASSPRFALGCERGIAIATDLAKSFSYLLSTPEVLKLRTSEGLTKSEVDPVRFLRQLVGADGGHSTDLPLD